MTEENAAPRLYLIAPGDVNQRRLEEALAAGDVACLLLHDAGPASRALVRTAQDHGVAALVSDDAALARALAADGVHLTASDGVEAARRALGTDAIVGACCGTSRHAAMLAGEAGADYVAFQGCDDDPSAAADPELLAWWQTMMTVPCVAMGRIAPGDAGTLARAGADFVALGDAVWSHKAGPGAAVTEAMAALARAGG